MDMDLMHQFLILFVMFSGGFCLIGFLFWFLFKKDAPSYDEVKEKFWVD